MTAVLVVIALIVYGTLYPWEFASNPKARLYLLLVSMPPPSPRILVDAVTNIVLYVPLGLTVFLQLRRKLNRYVAGLCSVAVASALSLSLEYAQYFQPTRYPNALDILTNTIGGALGVAVAGLWMRASSGLRAPLFGSILLWGSWIVSLMFPLFPSIGFYRLRMKVGGFFSFDPLIAISYSLQWLIASVLLLRLRPAWIGASFLLIVAQLFLLGRQPTLGALAGALAGASIALATRDARLLWAFGLTLLVLLQLAPFDLRPERASFNWIPFVDAMESSWSSAVAVVLGKFFIYAGLLALGTRARFSLMQSTVVVVILLAATEAGQTRITHRTPSVSDPTIGAASAAALSSGVSRRRLS